jgi:hypothetical protein
MMTFRSFVLAMGAALAGAPALAQFSVASTEPGLNANNIGRSAPIVVNFDRPVNRATVTSRSCWAFGRWTGPVAGTVAFSNGDATVTLTPTTPSRRGTGSWCCSRMISGAPTVRPCGRRGTR